MSLGPNEKANVKDIFNLGDNFKAKTVDKVIKLREERELFGRFLIIQGSRPELIPKLEDAIGEFEMSAVRDCFVLLMDYSISLQRKQF